MVGWSARMFLEVVVVESDNIITGRVNNVLPFLKRRLNGYLTTYGSVKVGADGWPCGRESSGHSSQSWPKMVVVYRAGGPGSIRSIERKLIARSRHALRCPPRERPAGWREHPRRLLRLLRLRARRVTRRTVTTARARKPPALRSSPRPGA